VERREGEGAWIEVASIEADARGAFAFEDRDVVPGAHYGYRLRVVGADQASAETRVDIPRAPVFALAGFHPNPAPASTLVEFSTTDARPATLELFDLQGRVRMRRVLDSLAPGLHRVRLETRDLSPGVYLVRVAQGGRSMTDRLVVSR
jgi:hypothetical protein